MKDLETGEEGKRLDEAREKGIPWKKWGPYLSERQWGTVREDYSDNGDAWSYLSHDQARSRAYRWGEDGLGGICDDHQVLCFALALWNGRDPILKERMFGLTNSEGNHGEDVKEYYFYLDSTPTHSYMKFLYKYPQNPFPYSNLVETNRSRSRQEMEYELLDTGIFDDDRYFDVFVEYAKAAPEDVLIRITICNRGPDSAPIDVLPTLWFRNTWSWPDGGSKPVLKLLEGAKDTLIHVHHTDPLFQEFLQDYTLACEGTPLLLFTENETNHERIFGQPNAGPYVKDGINDYVVNGKVAGVNPEQTGSKASAAYHLEVGAGESAVIRLRLSAATSGSTESAFGKAFDDVFAARLAEADAFYRAVTPPSTGQDEANVMRQALAGMLWSKQYYYFDADKWLEEHHAHPLHGDTRQIRNREWFHMVNDHIISMPDKWEYPWYAAWDLAFHTIALSVVDPDFAKDQLDLMLREVYLHPSGQIPACEWNFSDVNPPVHAWATLFLHHTEQVLWGKADIDFLKGAFAKLMLNFTWWVNRKDRFGKNVFEGGFLMPELLESVHPTGPGHQCVADRGIFALVNQDRLRRILTRMLDENEFLSSYGIRALSRCHLEQPYVFHVHGEEYRVQYLPAESDTGMFGGNSNWRGPIWMPVNALIIRALLQYYLFYGDNFRIECPTGSGKMMNLFEVVREISARLTRIFLRDEEGKRPVYGGTEKFQRDPYWLSARHAGSF